MVDRRQLPNRASLDALVARLNPAVIGLSVVVAILAVMATSSWVASTGAQSDLRAARLDAAVAQERASEFAVELADLRRESQSRSGAVADLESEVDDLSSELADARASAGTVQATGADATTVEESGPDTVEPPPLATSLAEVTTAVATTENVARAIHVTDVLDAQTLVGFDLREMLADGPAAGTGITIRLAGISAPAAGDCGRRQSIALTTAWLEATEFDILLRRPPDAPTTDALGRQLAEVLAFSNPSASLNVTLVVAGDAIVEEPATIPDPDPDLTERTRSAQVSAEGAGLGVWACLTSALLGRGDPAATPTPTPAPSADATDATPG